MASHLFALGLVLFACLSADAADNVPNPFLGRKYYVNPSYDVNIQRTIESENSDEQRSTVVDNLKAMKGIPSAYWIDVKAKTKQNDTDTNVVSGILADAQKKGDELVVFIVYDLPNRDCHAHASNGEICCHKDPSTLRCNYEPQDGNCDNGLDEYRTQYIDPFYNQLARFPSVPVVLVIEPDSLPNLATNQPYDRNGNERSEGNTRCGATTKTSYMEGVSYAVERFSQLKNTFIYIDAGHGGWLGWDLSVTVENQGSDERQIFRDDIILPMTTSDKKFKITDLIRGFATNVANYQPLGMKCPEYDTCRGAGVDNNPSHACCSQDPCNLGKNYNPAIGEINYVQALKASFADKLPNKQFGYLIDTGRNGVVAGGPRKGDEKSTCVNWCNIRGAGIGLKSGSRPSDKHDLADVDAFYWLKTPGESDGCTENLPEGGMCPRFDKMCASNDSIGSKTGEPRAPEAGHWFFHQIKELALNADIKGENIKGTAPPSTVDAIPIPSKPVNTNPTDPAPVVPGATGTAPVVPGATGTAPVVPGATGTAPVVPGATGTAPVVPGATGTAAAPGTVPGATAPAPPPGAPDQVGGASSLSVSAILVAVAAYAVGVLSLRR